MWPFKPKRDSNEFLRALGDSTPFDAPEEHHIQMIGTELTFNHATRTVIMVDQLGADMVALQELGEWFKRQGWFLHCVVSAPPKPPEEKSADQRR